MTDTPTPAQQLEDVLALRKAMATALANKEYATYYKLNNEAADIALGLVYKHTDTLRRALAALEAVEGADTGIIEVNAGEAFIFRDREIEGREHGQRVLIIPADAVEVSRG